EISVNEVLEPLAHVQTFSVQRREWRVRVSLNRPKTLTDLSRGCFQVPQPLDSRAEEDPFSARRLEYLIKWRPDPPRCKKSRKINRREETTCGFLSRNEH